MYSSKMDNSTVNVRDLSLCEEKPINDGDVIVAIDFGTTRTGFVWGIRSLIENTHLEVQPLENSVICVHDKKVPTFVLLRKNDNSVMAYGQRARNLYMDQEKHGKDYFFHNFKMQLHKNFQQDCIIEAANGETLELSTVLKKCLEYFKIKAIENLISAHILCGGEDTDITWVITVPAIWTESAKDIMRKAAFEGGLIPSRNSNHLVIALEPECAFIGSLQSMDDIDEIKSEHKKFLIMDCGGGTVDITAYEIVSLEPLKLQELISPDGGHLGSTLIDKLFFEFLKNFIGEDLFNIIVYSEQFLELEKNWEDLKVSFSFDKKNKQLSIINISSVLLELGNKVNFGDLVKKWNNKNQNLTVKKCATANLGISYDLMMTFFEKPVEDVISKVKEVLDKNVEKLKDLDYLVLAGGYCRNGYLQKRMRGEIQQKRKLKVIVGKELELLIVRGAALFAAKAGSCFSSRKAKYTFGICSTLRYNPYNATHAKLSDKIFTTADGIQRIHHVSVHGVVGEDVEAGTSTMTQFYYPVNQKQSAVNILILKTSKAEVFHPQEEGVEVLGSKKIILDTLQSYEDSCIGVEFFFGETEVFCYIIEKSSNTRIGKINLDYWD